MNLALGKNHFVRSMGLTTKRVQLNKCFDKKIVVTRFFSKRHPQDT